MLCRLGLGKHPVNELTKQRLQEQHNFNYLSHLRRSRPNKRCKTQCLRLLHAVSHKGFSAAVTMQAWPNVKARYFTGDTSIGSGLTQATRERGGRSCNESTKTSHRSIREGMLTIIHSILCLVVLNYKPNERAIMAHHGWTKWKMDYPMLLSTVPPYTSYNWPSSSSLYAMQNKPN